MITKKKLPVLYFCISNDVQLNNLPEDAITREREIVKQEAHGPHRSPE
jgi:hypothetical protein